MNVAAAKKKVTKKKTVKKPAVKQLTAASYSRLSVFEKCPLMAKYKYIDKVPEPGNVYSERGNVIHKNAEDYVLGNIKKLCKELIPFKKEIDKVKKAKVHSVEGKWTFDINWNPVDWFSKNAYLRVILDAMRMTSTDIIVIDYKTGKVYDEHASQMDLYAASANEKFPIEQFPQKNIITQLVYIDQKFIEEQTYTRDDAHHERLEWEVKIDRMLDTKRFLARPGYYCQWCSFSKSKGGQCKNG